jgi:hypothetical protein
LLKDDNAIKKQSKIAKSHGFPAGPKMSIDWQRYMPQPVVTHNCAMCHGGNPRKFFKEKTIQEKRLEQDIDTPTDRHSNGLKTNE